MLFRCGKRHIFSTTLYFDQLLSAHIHDIRFALNTFETEHSEYISNDFLFIQMLNLIPNTHIIYIDRFAELFLSIFFGAISIVYHTFLT